MYCRYSIVYAVDPPIHPHTHSRTRLPPQVDNNPFRLFQLRGIDLIAHFGAKGGECSATRLPYPFSVSMELADGAGTVKEEASMALVC